MLWLRYGVAVPDFAIVLVNGFGALIGTSCMTIYYAYASDKTQQEKTGLQLFSLLFGIMAAAHFGFLTTPTLGAIAAVASVTMLAAPLADLQKIWRKQDSAVLSLPSIVVASFSCTLWTAYGVVQADPFIVISNALGLGLSLIQLYVFFKYRGIHPHKFFPKDHLSYDHLEVSLPK